MSWLIKTKKHAGHDIEIKFKEYNNKLIADINGPRASSTPGKTYVNGMVWKVTSRIPFKSPTPHKVESEAWEMYKTARKRIDQAIAEYHKKRDEQYQ